MNWIINFIIWCGDTTFGMANYVWLFTVMVTISAFIENVGKNKP